MKSSSSTPVCRRCRYYAPEGRRGGYCQQLNVPVQGAWTACALAIPPFTPAWESVEDIIVWQQKTLAAMQQESAIADSLQEVRCTGEAAVHSHTHTIGSSPSSDRSSDTVPCSHTVSAFASSSSEPTIGIKALWT